MEAIVAVFCAGVLVMVGVALLGGIFEGIQSHAKDRYRSTAHRRCIVPPELIEMPRASN